MVELTEQRKRNVAYKISIGEILQGKPFSQEGKFLYLNLGEKKLVRVNVIANCVDKFIQEGEKKYASITIDDASGQIRLKAFGDDVEALKHITQGDTLQIIGNVREWNGELYIIPEVTKKVDPRWLLVRKLESQQKTTTPITRDSNTRDNILHLIKEAEGEGGIETETIIEETGMKKEHVNQELKRLLEEGIIYEPRPGRMRYLG